MTAFAADPGSFRDPSGQVFDDGARILRTVTAAAARAYEQARDAGVLERYAESGRVVATRELDPADWPIQGGQLRYVVEHPRLPLISYPYEWSFSLLRRAAIFHLELQRDLLDDGFVLSDATAYNVQFVGVKPVFIDVLSIRPYEEGEYWLAHNQFCEQFLNPLLLRACLGVHHNEWFRGRLEGIPTDALNRLLPLRRKLSFRMLSHVIGPARLQERSEKRRSGARIEARKLPKMGYRGMLEQLIRWISGLRPANSPTAWQEYEGFHTYSESEAAAKADFIETFVTETQPDQLWDIGCNTGAYSEIASRAGAQLVVGFDFDRGSLDRAVARATQEDLPLLPLFLDGANPSPDQGWAQRERHGLSKRRSADAIVALAFIHHLCIGKNVPMESAVDWLVDLAPTGVIEFVQKTDETVQEMLALREDIFEHYTEEWFLAALTARVTITNERRNPDNGRLLVAYRRKA